MPVKTIAQDAVKAADEAAKKAAAQGHTQQQARDAHRQADLARKERERSQRGQITLDNSPLYAWFPDTTFEIIDYTGVGTSLQYQSDGSEIIVESDDEVKFGLKQWETGEIEVHAVELYRPTSFYGGGDPYYTGPLVESPIDVGVWLSRRV